jgi:hypothetical protein
MQCVNRPLHIICILSCHALPMPRRRIFSTISMNNHLLCRCKASRLYKKKKPGRTAGMLSTRVTLRNDLAGLKYRNTHSFTMGAIYSHLVFTQKPGPPGYLLNEKNDMIGYAPPGYSSGGTQSKWTPAIWLTTSGGARIPAALFSRPSAKQTVLYLHVIP